MDHAATASATLGWIVDVKRDGDRLLELHQFLGESARDVGLRNKVSLGIDPHFVDGRGTQYGEAIVHSAVTPTPVVPDQGEFVALGGLDVELSLMSPDRAERTTEAGSPMVASVRAADRLQRRVAGARTGRNRQARSCACPRRSGPGGGRGVVQSARPTRQSHDAVAHLIRFAHRAGGLRRAGATARCRWVKSREFKCSRETSPARRVMGSARK